ncbi:MAG: cobalamin-dependent protein, partial [Candidatus Omnitrophota bacterium]
MFLINAGSNRIEKLGRFSRYVPLSLPMGIGALAAYLSEKGHEVRIWDDAVRMFTALDAEKLVKEAVERPHIFGISCLTASITRGHTIARFIKERFPDSFVVLGGIHPTVLPEDSLNTGYVDFVVRKEGEIPLESLCRALKSGDSYADIPGLSFRNSNGDMIHNPALPGPHMNSVLPFPYHLFEEHADKYNFSGVMGSRGCPYEC